jgi:Ni/Co efflux regulator RcnB
MRIDPEALAAALQRDQAPAAMLAIQDGGQTTAVEASRKDADRDALERGEDEGMIVRQQRQWTRGASVSERARPKADQHDDHNQGQLAAPGSRA